MNENMPSPEPVASPRLIRPWLAALIAVIAVGIFQTITLLRVMPPREWLNANPIVDRDYAFDFYNAHALVQCLKLSGHTWGYDPFWYAGYPIGVLIDVNNIGASIFCFLFSWLDIARAYKLFVFLLYLAVPLLAYPASRALGAGRAASAAAMALTFLCWNTYEEMVNYQSYGMFSFLFSAAAGVFVFACYVYFERKKTLAAFLPLVACALLYFPVHILGFLHAGLPMAVFFLFRIRSSRRFLAGSVLLVFLIFLLNWYWFGPVLHFREWADDSSHHLQPDVADLGKDFAMNTWFSFVVIFGFAGLYLWAKEGRKPLAVTLVIVALIYLFLGYFGSLADSLNSLQPKRFKVLAAFFLAPAAGFAILRWAQTVAMLFRRNVARPERLLAVLLALPILALLARPWPRDLGGQEITLFDFVPHKPYSISTAIPSQTLEIAKWINNNTQPNDRILIEDTELKGRTRYEVRDNARPLLAWLVKDRTFIGRYDPPGVSLYTATNFINGQLIKVALAALAQKDFEKFLRLYDIQWIMSFDKQTIEVLSKFDNIKDIARVGEFRVWHLTKAGAMVVKPQFNELRVTGAPEGETLLPYHWCLGLDVRPSLPISPVIIEPDPVPLIRVANGSTKDFTLYMSYGRK